MTFFRFLELQIFCSSLKKSLNIKKKNQFSIFITSNLFFFNEKVQEMTIFSVFRTSNPLFFTEKVFKKLGNESSSYRSFSSLYVDIGFSPYPRSFCLIYQRKHRKDNSSTLLFDGHKDLALRNLGWVMPT